MMKDVDQLHDQAMEFSDQADAAQRQGDVPSAERLFADAYCREREAAEAYVQHGGSEPKRSILLRSAATLAIECGNPRAAEQLAAVALSGDPPAEIADELRDLMSVAYSAQRAGICGKVAENMAATILSRQLDNVAVACVVMGNLVKRLGDSESGPGEHIATCSFLRHWFGEQTFDLGLHLDREFSATTSLVHGIDRAENVLVECVERLTTVKERSQGEGISAACRMCQDSLKEKWQELRSDLQRLHAEVFPGDWQPALEEEQIDGDWVISLPQGLRLVRVAATARQLEVRPRSEVRDAFAARRLEARNLHLFDTHSELYLYIPHPDLPGFRMVRRLDAEEVGWIVTEEMAAAATATGAAEGDTVFSEESPVMAVQTIRPKRPKHCVEWSARVANFLARYLEDGDELQQRVVWRAAARIMAAGERPIAPSEDAFATLFELSSKEQNVAAISSWLELQAHLYWSMMRRRPARKIAAGSPARPK